MHMKDTYKKIIGNLGTDRVAVDEPLFKYSSFKIGGPADLFYKAQSTEELIKAVLAAKEDCTPYFLLGGGTNLLISDKGFRGLVIKNESGKLRIAGIKGNRLGQAKGSLKVAYIEVDSGVAVNRLVRFSLDQGFGGLESFLGQPGTVGGAVYINAHNEKKGLFFGDAIESANILNKNGEAEEVNKDYFKFSYDQSILQKSGETLLSVIIKLKAGNKDELWHKAQEVLEYRRKSQPYGFFTAGCTFRNIKKSDALRLATPDYTCSAGFLIESLGLKGKSIRGAVFSDKHANFILNTNSAKAGDVLELINLAKTKVKKKFGLDLTEEIVFVGDF